MARGTFPAPRALGNVTDIKLGSVRIYVEPTDDEERVSALVQEGEDLGGGVFNVTVEKRLEVTFANMDPATKSAYNNLLRALLREYNTQEGYTGVVVN